MLKQTLSITLTLVAVAATASWAQPPEFTAFGSDEGPRSERWQERRMSHVSEYLELSESQAAEWQAILDQHLEGAPDRQQVFKSIADRREEFRILAAEESPDLELLGQLALEIHRAHESLRASREQLDDELQRILTPEQSEKLEALEAARDISGHRGRKSPRHRRSSADSN